MHRRKAITIATLTAAIFAGGLVSPAQAASTVYHVDNRAGSNCSNSGPHTEQEPFCDFTPLNAIGTLQPGDQVLLASGAEWNQQLTLTGSGTLSSPIVLSSYGSGERPKVLRSQGDHEIAVKIVDASYWDISNLELGRAAAGLVMRYTTLQHEHIRIRNMYVHDNKGIWSSRSVTSPSGDQWAVDENIHLSAGILFAIPQGVPWTSDQWVVRDIDISDVEGAHNLDSIAFAGNTFADSDGGDGSTQFRDIRLSRLYVHDDDSHVEEKYQAAGLGCSDSIRLMNASNVTMVDSLIDNVAACHTPLGTAAVFLQRVSDVTFVNNILRNTPDTNSNDQTAIDFEAVESDVTIRTNQISGNYGPGIEILNIHGDLVDKSENLDISGNSFSGNNANGRSGSSVYQLTGGGDLAIPSGDIRDNFTSEAYAPFGGNLSDMTLSNNLAVPGPINFAASSFSSTQGQSDWRYQQSSAGGTFVDLPDYDATGLGHWRGASGQSVGPFNLAPSAGNSVARTWTAPVDGTIGIRGQVLKGELGGEGIRATVNRIRGGVATQIWPSTPGGQAVDGDDGVGFATDLDAIEVLAGDQLRFEVGALGTAGDADVASWTPSISYTDLAGSALTWDFDVPRDTMGWTNRQGVRLDGLGGSLRLTAVGGDPNILSPSGLNLTAADYGSIEITAGNGGGDGQMQVFFQTASDPSWSESKSFSFTMTGSGMSTTSLPTNTVPTWAGTITQLRLDPAAGAGGYVDVDSITVHP